MEIMARRYITEVLSKTEELQEYINDATILLTGIDEGIVWDFMVLLKDDLFYYEFAKLYNESFVIDDHNHHPGVFTRVKSYKWLVEDFSRRRPIALWIFQKALVLQDPDNGFKKILCHQQKLFSDSIDDIISRKYMELRTERHNLRHALQKHREIASYIIKATIVKLALELCFLSEGKPFPWKKWLPETAQNTTTHGTMILKISEEFLKSPDHEKIIELSESLIQSVISFLKEKKYFSENFFSKWWLYLS